MPKMLTIGHRGGAAGYEPENTLLCAKKALELGVDMIEIDVQMSEDGRIMVIHDFHLEGTTNGNGYVSQKKADELRSLDAGKGEKIPFLYEVIELVNKKVPINIELKGLFTAEPVSEMIKDYIAKGWSHNDFILSCFDHEELIIVKESDPLIKTGALLSVPPSNFGKISGIIKPYSIHINKMSVDKQFTDICHKNNMPVYAFTVNEENVINEMKEIGVDGIFIDYPDRNKQEIT